MIQDTYFVIAHWRYHKHEMLWTCYCGLYFCHKICQTIAMNDLKYLYGTSLFRCPRWHILGMILVYSAPNPGNVNQDDDEKGTIKHRPFNQSSWGYNQTLIGKNTVYGYIDILLNHHLIGGIPWKKSWTAKWHIKIHLIEKSKEHGYNWCDTHCWRLTLWALAI